MRRIPRYSGSDCAVPHEKNEPDSPVPGRRRRRSYGLRGTAPYTEVSGEGGLWRVRSDPWGHGAGKNRLPHLFYTHVRPLLVFAGPTTVQSRRGRVLLDAELATRVSPLWLPIPCGPGSIRGRKPGVPE